MRSLGVFFETIEHGERFHASTGQGGRARELEGQGGIPRALRGAHEQLQAELGIAIAERDTRQLHARVVARSVELDGALQVLARVHPGRRP